MKQLLITILSLLVRLTAISLGIGGTWVGIEGNTIPYAGIFGNFIIGLVFIHYGLFKKEIMTR